jgi:hypothetical protein
LRGFAVALDTFSVEDLLRKRKRLRRELLETPRLQGVKIAVLGGSTTNEVVELLLLADGFAPNIYESEYKTTASAPANE